MNQSSSPSVPHSSNYTDLSLLQQNYSSVIQQAEAPALEFCSNPETIQCARTLLQNQGFVILKNVIKKDLVLSARNRVLKYLESEGKLTSEGTIQLDKGRGVLLTGFKPLTHTSELLAVTECPSLFKAISCLLRGQASTFDTKWLRVKGKDEFTEIHSDYFRFESVAKQASGPFLVAWIPLCQEISPSEGGLSLLHKSQSSFDFSAQCPDTQIPVDFPSSLSHKSTTQIWSTNSYEAGDVVIFDIKTLHTSFRNTGPYYRISVDTRWMLKKDFRFL